MACHISVNLKSTKTKIAYEKYDINLMSVYEHAHDKFRSLLNLVSCTGRW